MSVQLTQQQRELLAAYQIADSAFQAAVAVYDQTHSDWLMAGNACHAAGVDPLCISHD